MSTLKDIETARHAKEKAVKMFQSAQNARAEEWSKSSSNWAQACIPNQAPSVLIVKERAKFANSKTNAKHAMVTR